MKAKTFVAGGLILAGMLGFFGNTTSVANSKKAETAQCFESSSKRVEKNKYFENGQISHQLIHSDGKLIRERYWSFEGKQTYETHYTYSKNDDTYEITKYSTDPLMDYIKEKEQYRGTPEGKHTLLCRWFYDEISHHLLVVEHYHEGTEIVEKMDTFNQDEELEETFVYFYVPGKEKNKVIKGFDRYNSKGERVGSYNSDTALNIEGIITSRDASLEQIEKWLHIYRDDKRIPVAVIDTGFDISHPSLTHKIWKNPKEELNGIDDDGNGWIDDIMGWHRKESQYYNIDIDSPNINETLILKSHSPALSHGTHIASVALEGLDGYALVGFAGSADSDDFFRKIGSFLKDHKILFANMSFSLKNPYVADKDKPLGYFGLDELIRENQQTLFFVAAGNFGIDYDLQKFEDFPASFPYENILVVGALDTDEIVESELPNYKVTDYSNTGCRTVDIFAPGENVPGALVGGGTISKGGTSLSSPYALKRTLENIHKENPNLTALEIKEIILKTAYVLEKPLPCVSRGIIYPRRMLDVARLLAKNPLLSIDEAVSKILDSEFNLT